MSDFVQLCQCIGGHLLWCFWAHTVGLTEALANLGLDSLETLSGSESSETNKPDILNKKDSIRKMKICKIWQICNVRNMQNMQNMPNMHASKYAKYDKYAKYLLGHILAYFYKKCKNMRNTRTGRRDPSGCWAYFTYFCKIAKYVSGVHIFQTMYIFFGSWRHKAAPLCPCERLRESMAVAMLPRRVANNSTFCVTCESR